MFSTILTLILPKSALLCCVFFSLPTGELVENFMYEDGRKTTKTLIHPILKSNIIEEGCLIRSDLTGVATFCVSTSGNHVRFAQMSEATNTVIREIVVDGYCCSLIPVNDSTSIWWIDGGNQVVRTDWKSRKSRHFATGAAVYDINKVRVTHVGRKYDLFYFEGNGMATAWYSFCSVDLTNLEKPKLKLMLKAELYVSDAGLFGNKFRVLYDNGSERIDNNGKQEKPFGQLGVSIPTLGETFDVGFSEYLKAILIGKKDGKKRTWGLLKGSEGVPWLGVKRGSCGVIAFTDTINGKVKIAHIGPKLVHTWTIQSSQSNVYLCENSD